VILAPSSSVTIPVWMWLLFGGVVLVSLVLDLIAHRGAHGLSRRSAITWSLIWVGVSFAFAGLVWKMFGGGAAEQFVSAYLMEKSLSVDNLFVFLVVFSRLQIPTAEQHRVLFWGIVGALISRAVFIGAGAALLARWHAIVYVFGAFLIYGAIKVLRAHSVEPGGESRMLAFLRRHVPMTNELHGHRFFVREGGRRLATPLLLALLTIEATDIMFAVDSVPAVFAISEQPFIVYSSNVFAILGMRALYLVLADLLRDLVYLHYGLAAILAFAGGKMLLSGVVHLPPVVSLGAIVVILLAAIIPSVAVARRHRHERCIT
jgi:tellurite resistance protein TerC